jgi:MFS family permease
VALLAETIPAQARPYTLGMLQSFSTVGNCSAGLLFIGLGNVDQESLKPLSAWQIMFLVGIVPAILVIFIQTRLKEPESWLEAKRLQREGKDHPRVGSYRDLFEDPRWRRHALLGALLAFSGVVGLWGIGFFSTDLTQTVIRKSFTEQGMSPAEVDRQVMTWGGITGIVMNIGALFGMLSFSWLTNYTGRRIAFAIAFVAAAMSTILVFWKLETKSDIFWMVPLMGFCQLALFGGYAIYLPELFPTRLRSTGTSFCYNVGRFVAAAGPLLLIPIRTYYKNEGFAEPQRQAAMTMCSVFALGFVAIFFLPETKGKPLPE